MERMVQRSSFFGYQVSKSYGARNDAYPMGITQTSPQTWVAKRKGDNPLQFNVKCKNMRLAYFFVGSTTPYLGISFFWGTTLRDIPQSF